MNGDHQIESGVENPAALPTRPLGRVPPVLVAAPAGGSPWFPVAMAVLIALAAVLRLYDLPRMPFHHDESIHAVFSHRVSHGQAYLYDPTYHGPFLYYLVGLVFAVLGDSDTTARLYPAVFGILLVPAFFLLSSRLGKMGVLVGAATAAASPVMTYFSRFLRNDVPLALMCLVALAAILKFLDGHGPNWLILGAAAAAAAFTAKEVSFIILFQWTLAAAVVSLTKGGLGSAWLRIRKHAWSAAAAGALFTAIFCLLFSSFTIHPAGILDGAFRWILYWWGQHDIGRIPGPWYYHALRIAVYEPWVFLFCSLVSVYVLARKRTGFAVFLLVWAWSSLVLYTYLREKVPWLIVHIVLPMMLLLAYGVNDVWTRPRRDAARRSRAATRTVITVLLVLSFSYGLASSIALCLKHPANPREMLVFTQTSPDVLDAVSIIENVVRPEEQNAIEIKETIGWPLAWYLRNYAAAYPKEIDRSTQAAVVLVDADDVETEEALRGAGYDSRRFKLRAWWEPLFAGVPIKTVAAYWVGRRPFSSTGSYDFYLMLSPGAQRKLEGAASPAAGVQSLPAEGDSGSGRPADAATETR